MEEQEQKNKARQCSAPVWKEMQKTKYANLNNGSIMLGGFERVIGSTLTLNGKFEIKAYEGSGYIVFKTESGDEIPAKQFIGGFTGTKSVELAGKTYQGTLETTPTGYIAFHGLQNVIYDEMLKALKGKTVKYLGSQVKACITKEGKQIVIKKHFWEQVD